MPADLKKVAVYRVPEKGALTPVSHRSSSSNPSTSGTAAAGNSPPGGTRVALVTGGAVRVGRAITLALAEAGFDVVVGYHGSGAAAREMVEEVERTGRRAHAVRADLAASAGARKLAHAAATAFGRLDLLVNSASTFFATPFEEISEEEWDQVMAVNLKAPFLLIQATASMLAESRGHVVNIVDLSALRPWASHPHHSVSKAALAHLTRVAARVLAPRVRVNAIAPGSVLPEEDATPEAIQAAAARIPLGGWGSPEDVARTVLFLDQSPFMTGEVIVLDGGEHGAT